MPMILFLISIASGFLGGLGAQIAGDRIRENHEKAEKKHEEFCVKYSTDNSCK